MIALTARRVLASLPVVLLGACGTVQAPAAAPSSVATTTTSSTARPTTTTATEVPGPPPTAADGTDLAACADGICEVVVKTGDVLHVPVGPLTVVVGGGQAGVRPDPSSGMTGLLAGPPGWVGMFNNQAFTVGVVQGEQAVLKLGPR
ncbi:hypothetical protein [Saccharothrix luteola]|uniref:hypothetical protein n=1 Tax=Saccharothrix luteola TaxID=2893018 RepID=UPI001E566E44|nr:hypothetical protein [Saccharothrix luteola]MCC8246854.1 hypothetical protein [Saccharothrix luteola]